MRIKFIAAFLTLIFFSPALFAQEKQPNGFCPVMQGERIKKKFYAEWNGEKIYLCCRSCVKKFNKDPERYIKNL